MTKNLQFRASPVPYRPECLPGVKVAVHRVNKKTALRKGQTFRNERLWVINLFPTVSEGAFRQSVGHLPLIRPSVNLYVVTFPLINWQIPVAARRMACGLSLAGVASSNPAETFNVFLLWVSYGVSYRSLRWADPSSREVVPTVVYHCVITHNNNPLHLQWLGRKKSDEERKD